MSDNLFSVREGFVNVDIEFKFRDNLTPHLKICIYTFLIKPHFSKAVGDFLHDRLCKYFEPALYQISENGELEVNDLIVTNLISANQWSILFDVIEIVYQECEQQDIITKFELNDSGIDEPWLRGDAEHTARNFQTLVNRVLNEEKIGWRMVDGKFQASHSQPLEKSLSKSVNVLEMNKLKAAMKSVEDSLAAFNRRPEPDLRAAISHAYSALESVAREITTKPNELGKQFEYLETLHLLPENSKAALKAVWGWVNDSRHLKEENIPPEFEEAEFLVTVATGLTVYLMAKHYKNRNLENQPEPEAVPIAPEAYDDDIPF